MPGLLLHFLRNGTYQSSIWGPNFYFNFIRRIQSDDPENLKFGDPDKYFDFTEDQKTFVGMILKETHIKYGDIYEEVNARGYE